MSKITLTIDIDSLEAGFEACFLLRDHCRNVIASGDFEDADKEYEQKCSKFIMAYNRAVNKHNKMTRKFSKLRLNKLQKTAEKLVQSIVDTSKNLNT